ncbi:MAG: hypothetical protein P8105_04895 [Dehalococcoidia bacterium]
MEDNEEYRHIKDLETGSDILVHPMLEWECPLCGATSVIQRISKFENILRCESCDWRRDLNFA